MEKQQKYRIYLLLVFVMMAWGINVIMTKVIVAEFLPVTITSLRVFTAGISVFIILFFLKKVRIPTKKEFLYIVFGCFFNVVGHHYFLSIGLSKTSASNGGLILGLGPLLTTIVAFCFLGNKVTVWKMLGIILGLTGVSFIVMEGSGGVSGISLGDLFVFLAILSQAISFAIIKKASATLDPRLMTGYMLVFGSIILFIISLFKEPHGLQGITHGSMGVWLIFLASAIFGTAISHTIYNYSLGKVGVSEAAIFINLNPFFALIAAVMFLGEKITLPQILGFVFIIIGVLFGSGALEEYFLQSRQKRESVYLKKVKSSS
ncbi:DMT family transporter [Neobacillus ginsengisoli]|uniref:Drug/metabolite transporter (DMT)-like permease n=1 Tax=Neobacillus ginsengisoli TaxID=904295 RepID=A0ABT9XYD7_9BACI|nr:DMT family transporter [Neobacillus ginsengisoli]MDQ0200499.1 drug/metabolite transporter (DMT)-like permease [Neobacillus ginsengisoli]